MISLYLKEAGVVFYADDNECVIEFINKPDSGLTVNFEPEMRVLSKEDFTRLMQMAPAFLESMSHYETEFRRAGHDYSTGNA